MPEAGAVAGTVSCPMVDMARLTFISIATDTARARDFMELLQPERLATLNRANPCWNEKFSQMVLMHLPQHKGLGFPVAAIICLETLCQT